MQTLPSVSYFRNDLTSTTSILYACKLQVLSNLSDNSKQLQTSIALSKMGAYTSSQLLYQMCDLTLLLYVAYYALF